MKRYITTFLTIAMLAVSLPMFAGSASAQTRTGYGRDRYSRPYSNDQRVYQNNDEGYYGYGYEQPSTYDKHRKAVNLAAGAGLGALIGALVGGKKGALIGGAAGLAGGAVVTAKQKPRNPNSNDYYRNQNPYYY